MLDIGWQELFIIGMVLLIVVKPRDIPDVIVTIREYIAKLRGFSREFHHTVDDLVRESQIHEMKDDVEQQARHLVNQMDHDMGDFDVDEWLDKPIMPEKSDKKADKKAGASNKSTAKKSTKKPVAKKQPAKKTGKTTVKSPKKVTSKKITPKNKSS
ncbi:MAG: hypothetical protein K0U45_05950 [Alphaproteobacteria bacterium]|nr:hypothetical protein [Alphaproteobacteria bacterium]